MEVPIELIRPSPYQPRLAFDLEDIRGGVVKALKEKHLPNLIVRKVKDHYELIDGERRWRIAKQEGFKTVPCQIVEANEEIADRMIWKVNTLRKNYTVEERAKHFKKHQDEGMSARAIGRIHGYSNVTVSAYLSIFKLPEEYRQYVWDGKFGVAKIQRLYERGLLDESVKDLTPALSFINQSITQDLKDDEFEKILTETVGKVEELRLKIAKKAIGKVALEIKEPETPEEFDKAAETLKKEAERRKTPEQKAEEKRRKLIAQARTSLNAALKKIDGASKIIDVSDFRERFIKLEKSLEQNPAEAREQLIALGKEVDGAKKQRQREIEEEKRKKREEKERRRLEEEMKKRVEEERKQLEEEARKKLEAERKRMEEESREKMLRDREFLEQAEKRLKKERFEELKVRKLEGWMVKRPQINVLNELTGKEWLEFTKSWYTFDALESDLAEERALTAGLTEEHPATFSPTMISDYVRFFTKRDAVVFDPFVGIGSTLVACSRAGRKGIGIDINEQYVEITTKRLNEDPRQKVILGDAWDIEKYSLPKIDYCVTSPPYFRMLEKIDVTQRRRIRKGLATDYGESVDLPEEVNEYINDLVNLFSKIAKITKEDGYLTVILQNFRDKEKMVPLAWQFAIAMQNRGDWIFKGERIWCQDHKGLHPFGQKFEFVSNIHHHYCLIFRKRS